MLIQQNAHDDAHIIFGAVIDDQMDGHMRVTVIATGFEKRAPVLKEVPPLKEVPILKRVENGDTLPQETISPSSYQNLKTLAHAIKETTPGSLSKTINFDIPTFLRKHAD